ncbi:MAG: hypothetical protein J0L57_16255, partial [Burkholderiales bacterium]|nr:hypothetical protein [Burkholderiales bacterium]
MLTGPVAHQLLFGFDYSRYAETAGREASGGGERSLPLLTLRPPRRPAVLPAVIGPAARGPPPR